ncbi:hypothetical protein AURDEDRAFT_114295 [Auricularia subglabra TFB-10046 SS5]|uniref:MYND-type domain-containing protein n=1 Tax=Auricularia subglabra (strain TFB-10046 / SS5) TaxID=717982 RepID=J0DDL8_AURST|nr:hypothetical protein AURDEDRAFT_114295 [Auricularia subglabra TFB-10046 SS5]
MSGLSLFKKAEMAYMLDSNVPQAFDLYVQSIRKIIKNEDVAQKFPQPIPVPDMPQELLGIVWRNFVGFFRDPALGFTVDNAPDAYKLLLSFKPSSTPAYPEFEKRSGKRGAELLKGMQITAGFTLGLMAWDKRDRATAAKRYNEALALAETHAPFVGRPTAPRSGLELYVYNDVQECRSNLAKLVASDAKNAQLLGDAAVGRKETKELPLPTARIEPDGSITALNEITFATDVCHACQKRDVKLSKCSKCKKATYCGRECQTAHWPSHKAACKKAAAAAAAQATAS